MVVDGVANYHILQSAMKGKKRKGAAGPKQPKPKQPKPKPKGKPDNLGWVGPVSPQGRALKERLEERAKSRIQFVKCFLKGFIRGRNKLKNKIVTHFRLMVGHSHKKRKLAGLAVLVQLAKCMPCEEDLDSSKPTRPEGWKPKPGQVQDRLLRSAWSQRFEAPVRGLMWCPWLAQATPGNLGKWVDRDCNAALNLQRAGESKWRPLELCRWQQRGRLPAQGKEYPALGFKKLREQAPKALAQQPVAQ
ncbi:hypothetical protein QJQ45_001748 [Haematococcus lacustris]|nr:hypothetical protein QJQ45_001748 [Haematococcus lacustris]